MTGVVASFDDHVGLGVIRAEDGSQYRFHCSAIADGSRTIAVGARVMFKIVAGHLGKWEAADVEPT